MKTTVKFNKENEKVTVTLLEIYNKTQNNILKEYLNLREVYATFCENQTKRGQSRKNERGRVRRNMFKDIDSVSLDQEILEITQTITKEKEAAIDKIEVEIEYDGRIKIENFFKIKEGVRMALFIPSTSTLEGISYEYYELGLINYRIK